MGKIELTKSQRIELMSNLIGHQRNDERGIFNKMVDKALEDRIVLTPLPITLNISSLIEAINEFNKAEFETIEEKVSVRKWIEYCPIEDLHEIFGSIWDDANCKEESLLIIRKVAKAISKDEF